MQALYQYDCLRANKSTMAWGVEARVPFLDRGFLDVAMAIDPADKMIDKAAGEMVDVALCCFCGGGVCGEIVARRTPLISSAVITQNTPKNTQKNTQPTKPKQNPTKPNKTRTK